MGGVGDVEFGSSSPRPTSLEAFALGDEYRKAREQLVSLYKLDQMLAKELDGDFLNELYREFEGRMHFKDNSTS